MTARLASFKGVRESTLRSHAAFDHKPLSNQISVAFERSHRPTCMTNPSCSDRLVKSLTARILWYLTLTTSIYTIFSSLKHNRDLLFPKLLPLCYRCRSTRIFRYCRILSTRLHHRHNVILSRSGATAWLSATAELRPSPTTAIWLWCTISATRLWRPTSSRIPSTEWLSVCAHSFGMRTVAESCTDHNMATKVILHKGDHHHSLDTVTDHPHHHSHPTGA